jgi:hypothetical protein
MATTGNRRVMNRIAIPIPKYLVHGMSSSLEKKWLLLRIEESGIK